MRRRRKMTKERERYDAIIYPNTQLADDFDGNERCTMH